MTYIRDDPLAVQIVVGLVIAELSAVMAGRFLGLRQSWIRNAATGVAGLAGGAGLSGALTSRQPGATSGWVLFVALTLLATMVSVIVSEVVWPTPAFTQVSRGGIPHPLRALKQQIHRSRRLLEVTLIATRYGLGSFVGRRAAGSSSSTATGRNLRYALNDAGGVFIKLGQFLSTRPDVVPQAVIVELAQLQDNASPVPVGEVWRVIREELGEGAPDLFKDFCEEPVASASIAQVHRAVLMDGTEVALKVQRPGIDLAVERDIDVMRQLARIAERRSSTARSLRAVELVDGFASSLRNELDFRIEARNMDAIRSAEGEHSQVAIAAVSESLVTRRVLTMEWFAGERLAVAAALISALGLDRHEVACRLFHALLRQIAFAGVFHADPHPGNVRMLADGRVALLDFGSVGRLTGAQLEVLRTLLASIQRNNAVLFADCLLELAYPIDSVSEDRFRRSTSRFMVERVGEGGGSAELFTRLLDIVRSCGVSFPGEIAAVFRCLVLLEGTLQLIEPGFDMTREVEKTSLGSLGDVGQLVTSGTPVLDELTSYGPILRRLPRRIDRITAALETGRLVTGVRLGVDPALDRRIDDVADLLVLAFLGPALGAVSAMLLGLPRSPELTPDLSLYQLLGYAGLCLSFAILFRVIALVLRHRRA